MQVTTMASSVVAANPSQQQHHMDRLDAARALLGVSPQAAPESSRNNSTGKADGTSTHTSSSTSTPQSSLMSPSSKLPSPSTSNSKTFSIDENENSNNTAEDPQGGVTATKNVTFEKQAKPSSASCALNGLDALAALASKEQATIMEEEHPNNNNNNNDHSHQGTGAVPPIVSSSATSSDNDDDSEAMPPPPPRAGGRRRSVSNPEGMEKWAPYNTMRSSRRDFVLPASILEEELAEASAAMEAHAERKNSCSSDYSSSTDNNNMHSRLPFKKRGSSLGHEEDHSESSDATAEAQNNNSKAPISGLMSADEQANLTPEELLKRARSRLLEDLSEGSLNGEKGGLTLPHSLAKYKEVYNKNGRIGIYTPAERAAIIARFQRKRSRRVWNKKIRYNCRKNLADRRMRVKGRFVKRSTEQMAKAKQEEEGEKAAVNATTEEQTMEDAKDSSDNNADEDMPDVNDPDAGFCPTEDQPYRRTRRHTIT